MAHSAATSSTRRDLLALLALCALTGFVGLATHGVTNWQEGIRLLVATEMHAAGEWIVPTVHRQPYLAKPPLIYWTQLALSPLTGGQVTLATLRLSVALAGTLSVVLMYFFVRSALRDADQRRPDALGGGVDNAFADRAAFWTAALLATSILFVRNMRIGELDIMIIPPAIVAVWGIWAAWRAHAEEHRTSYAAIAVACVGAIGAALAKGPPGLLTPLLAGYGAIALAHAAHFEQIPSRGRAWFTAAGGLIAFGIAIPNATDINSVIGAVFFAGSAAFGAQLALRLVGRRLFPKLFRVAARTHPVGVPVAGAAGLFAWSQWVNARVGDAVSERVASGEAADNLRILELDAPVRTLEFLGYAGGLGSILCIAAFVWLLRDRPRLGRAGWIALAWTVLPLIAFSCIGKGVQRYLLPTLPGICMLAGLLVAAIVRDLKTGHALQRVFAVVLAVLAIGQAYWYGFAREDRFSARSPRAFVAELGGSFGFEPGRLAALDLWTPAIDFYVGSPVQPFYQIDTSYDYPHPVSSADSLVEAVRSSGEPWTVFIRADRNPFHPSAPLARERLEAMGFMVQSLPVEAEFRTDKLRTPVEAVRVRWP